MKPVVRFVFCRAVVAARSGKGRRAAVLFWVDEFGSFDASHPPRFEVFDLVHGSVFAETLDFFQWTHTKVLKVLFGD